MLDTIYIPMIRIRPSNIVTYAIPTTRPRRTPKQEETEKNLTRGKFNGTISDKAQRKLRLISEGWLLSIQEAKKAKKAHTGKKKNYITFVTLTLSAKQAHDDNEIKRELLNEFIITAKRKFGVQEYVWRAESQKNGNIHFHLFLDKYIHWNFLRVAWNGIQEKLGYISEFERINGHRNPNSTDIERIKSPKGATIYITKYIAKESENRIIKGRLWGCSDNLRTILAYENQIDSQFQLLLENLKKDENVRHITEDHYQVFLGDIRTILRGCYPKIEEEIASHYEGIYLRLYP